MTDLSLSVHRGEPAKAGPDNPDRGPALFEIASTIRPLNREVFLASLHDLALRQMRDESYGWRVFEDAATKGRYHGVVPSPVWTDHLCLHGRETRDDAIKKAPSQAFHHGAPPLASQLLALRLEESSIFQSNAKDVQK